MKRLKLFLLSAAMFVFAGKASEVTTLVVNLKTGQTIEFTLAERPVVAYSDGMLAFSTLSESNSETFELSNVRTFTYSTTATPSGIVTVKSNSHPTTIRVFNINGVQVRQCPLDSNGSSTFNLNELEPGIYIVNDGTSSHKVLVK